MMSLQQNILDGKKINNHWFALRSKYVSDDLLDIVNLSGDCNIIKSERTFDDDGYEYHSFIKTVTLTKQFIEGVFTITIEYEEKQSEDIDEARDLADISDDINRVTFEKMGNGQMPGNETQPFKFNEKAC